jgi:hypothetical protein
VASSVKTLGFIFRSCKRFRSESCLRALYFTLVRSKLEYCSIVWSPIYRRGVDALESVQRKFAKYLLFKLIAEFPPRGTPNSVLYDMANLRSLNMRRNDSFLIFLYKIIHGIINSPFLLSQIYFNVPRANLRSGRFFYVPRAVTNILHRSPLYTACTLFNSNCSECDIFVISCHGSKISSRSFFGFFFADLVGVEGPWVPLMLGDAPSLLEHLESNLKSNQLSKLSLTVKPRVTACYRDCFVRVPFSRSLSIPFASRCR